MLLHLTEKLPRPDDMKPDAYQRNLAARAFDVARYTLFFGIPTGVGQVTSIRTLERQIRRLKSSQYAEVRDLAEEIAAACAQSPACAWDEKTAAEPVAPTLARHVEIAGFEDFQGEMAAGKQHGVQGEQRQVGEKGIGGHRALLLKRSPDGDQVCKGAT